MNEIDGRGLVEMGDLNGLQSFDWQLHLELFKKFKRNHNRKITKEHFQSKSKDINTHPQANAVEDLFVSKGEGKASGSRDIGIHPKPKRLLSRPNDHF